MAGLQFAHAISQFPSALSTCKGMGDDLKSIEDWAKIFTEPKQLAEKLAMNYVRHHKEINTDIKTLGDDWDMTHYFDAGKELGDISVLAVGPIKTTLGTVNCGDFSLDTVEIADFIAGFINGFTGKDDKTYLEGCFKDDDSFEQDVCDAVADFRTKDNQKVLEGVQKILSDLPKLNSYMAGCPNATADFAVVQNWFKYYKAQGEMKVYSTLYRNVVANMSTVTADAKQLESYFDKKDWYDAAVMASTIAKIALPVVGDSPSELPIF